MASRCRASSYTFNFNQPTQRSPNGGINVNRIFDADYNSFKFDVGELVLLKDTLNPENVGFRTDITYGFSVPEVTQSTADTGDGVSILLNWAGGQEAIGNQAAFSNNATNIFDIVLDAALIHDARCNCPPCTDGKKTVLYWDSDAKWWGVVGIIRHDYDKWFSINLRGEFFDDEDGT